MPSSSTICQSALPPGTNRPEISGPSKVPSSEGDDTAPTRWSFRPRSSGFTQGRDEPEDRGEARCGEPAVPPRLRIEWGHRCRVAGMRVSHGQGVRSRRGVGRSIVPFRVGRRLERDPARRSRPSKPVGSRSATPTPRPRVEPRRSSDFSAGLGFGGEDPRFEARGGLRLADRDCGSRGEDQTRRAGQTSCT